MCPAKKVTTELVADLVVIGGGGSGLPAALSAAEAGVKNIIVLEKARTLGGNANMAGGMFAVESPAQKRLGVQYTRDEVFKEKMDFGNWQVDPRVVRTFINSTAGVIQWLESKGLIFNCVTEFVTLGDGPKVYHMFSEGPEGKIGKTLMKTLARNCVDAGVQIIRETGARHLLTDKKGIVTGVLAYQKGEEIKIAAKAVTIAAGDFAGNKEMMQKYFPANGYRLSLSLPHTGDGLIMAAEVGAVTDDIITMFFNGPHHYPYADSLNCLLRRPEMMIINKLGERFGTESLWLGYLHQTGNPLARQPGEICYGLIDAAALQTMIQRREIHTGMEVRMGVDWFDEVYEDLRKDATKGVAKIGNSWDEIAAFIGAAPEILKATVKQYNEFCDNGYDADFLKEKRFLFPLRKPPYYAILGRNGFDSTFGGIKINQRMEVINKKFAVIKGLYATGNNAGSCISRVYHPKHAGTSLSFAVCSGYIAGKSAAAYISGKDAGT